MIFCRDSDIQPSHLGDIAPIGLAADNRSLNPILLESFSPTESLDFLKRSLIKRKDNDDDLNTLAERLGHLPLALELASRYLNGHTRLSVTDYLAQTKEALEHASMNAWKKDVLGLTPTQHDTSLLST